MTKIKPFKGLRPQKGLEKDVSELPYDVVNRDEAKTIAKDNTVSFYHVIKPEIDLPDDRLDDEDRKFEIGKKNLDKLISDNILVQDETPCLYIYTLTMSGRKQTGIIACASVDDYLSNEIRKHEHTLKAKEIERTRHIRELNAHTGPVFCFYYEDGSKKDLFSQAMKLYPIYDFIAEDGVSHTIRVIDDPGLIELFIKSFQNNVIYIADGHHRAAAAAVIAQERRNFDKKLDSDDECNYFLTVIFPHHELAILPYNRIVKDLNNMSKEDFLKRVESKFTIEKNGVKTPETMHNISVYINGDWFSCAPKFSISSDSIQSLDVSILQDHILGPILGIEDPRTDKRVTFIGGIRGTGELERLVDSGEYSVAFSLYPTGVDQLMCVADSNGVMPPKSTWFEPKLRSGLVVHLI